MPAIVMPDIDDSRVVRDQHTIDIEGLRIATPRKNDYVVLWEAEGKSKRLLAQVAKLKDDMLFVILEDGRYDEDTRIATKFPIKHLLANLGPDPIDGSVYGTKVELWRETVSTPVGDIHYFTRLDDTGKAIIKDAIKFAVGVYSKLGLKSSVFPLEFQVRKGGGKFAGTYKGSGGATKRGTDIPKLDVVTFKLAEYDKRSARHVMLHELGHAVWSNLMTDAECARWVRSYHRAIQVESVTADVLEEVRNDFLAAGPDYAPPNEEHEQVYNEACAYIERKHYIDWKHLTTLLNGGQSDVVRDMWPSYGDLTSQGEMVTEYSKESPTEYFCEAVALHHAGATLPESVLKLVDNTFKQVCKRNKS